MSKKPNILFVFTDQQRSTALGCAGVEDVRTPHLDHFASQGTRFTNALANTPSCSPARATLLTGRHAMNHGLIINDLPLRTDLPHVAQSLTADGYRCGYIGKWHVDGHDRGGFIPPGERRRGFDDFWAVANCTHNYNGAHYYLNDDPKPYWHEGYEPFSQTDIAEAYLRDRAGDGSGDPFCLFLSYGPPHFPYMNAPDAYNAMYADRGFRLLPNCRPETEVDQTHVQWGMYDAGATPVDIIAGYYAHQTAIDDCFGRLMATLDELGVADDTLVIYTSDHGDMLYSHGEIWKAKPWRESVGVPMLIRQPGRVPAGRVSDAPIGLVDMMPTLLGAAGIEQPDAMDGRDLSALLAGDEAAASDDQFITYPCMYGGSTLPPWRGVVTRTHTYVRSNDGPYMLFDDKADPYQMTNLVDDPAQADLVAELEARTQAWMARTGDRLEPSESLADRFAEKHRDGVAPMRTNPRVREGDRDPAKRRYRALDTVLD